jgi:hypothetical protein
MQANWDGDLFGVYATTASHEALPPPLFVTHVPWHDAEFVSSMSRVIRISDDLVRCISDVLVVCIRLLIKISRSYTQT